MSAAGPKGNALRDAAERAANRQRIEAEGRAVRDAKRLMEDTYSRTPHAEKFTDGGAAFAAHLCGILLWVVAWFTNFELAFLLFALGLLCIVHGFKRCRKWRCSECKNPLHSKEVRKCAACGARLG